MAIVYRRRYFDRVATTVDAVADDVFRKFLIEDFPKVRADERAPADESYA